ncbi:MAG: glucose 1-dehydrogenase [Candidatus Dormibacteraeota bacterium]|nr:glucose 1-dehydrogenase [Candidatus Dormibacteraeota bacterium]
MKAIAVIPGQAGSIRLADLPRPRLNEVSEGRGVLVRVLSVGLDGTDKEINAAAYGAAPPGSEFLVLGHESLGVVEQVGPGVTEVQPGDRVVATVRRPGNSLYDSIGLQDFTTDDTYHEHGISTLHGFLTEYYVDDARYLVKVPVGLGEAAVLLEPTSVAEKGIAQAYEIQRRLRVWSPRRAAVLGAGPLGLLASMILRLGGLQVTTLGLDEAPYLNSEMAEALGARYLSTRKTSLAQLSEREGPFDLIFEATGFSPLVFEAMAALAKNGVLVLSSVTGGDRQAEVPADRLNLGFVLGNKVMVGTVNASRGDFEAGVRDLAMMDEQDPGWLQRFITHRVKGLGGYSEAFEMLNQRSGTIKVVVEVAAEESRMQAAGMARSTPASG